MGVTLIDNPNVTSSQVESRETVPVLKKSPRTRILALLLVVTASTLPFLPSLRYGFVYDDEMQIIGNQTIQKGGFFRSYFTTPVGGFYDSTRARPYYRPLFMLWLRLNYLAFGKRPFGWHLTTLAAHMAATLLVFALLSRHLTSPRAAIAGAIAFGLHPVHTESVAWISGVTDPLVGVAMLASLLLWLKAQARPSTLPRAASLLCYAAALLTKEIAVVLPALIFVYSVIGTRNQIDSLSTKISVLRRALLSTLPYIGTAALYLIARHYVVRGVYTGTPWISVLNALITAPSVAIFYLRHLLWPADLSLYYDFPIVISAQSTHFWVPLLLLGGLGASGLLLWKNQKDQLLPALFAWLLLPLLPVSNIALFSPDDFVHDRYLYLPVIALSLGVALILEHLTQKRAEKWRHTAATAVAAVIIAPLGISSVLQSRPWRDNFALYQHTVNHSPQNAIALNNFACVYASRGQFQKADELFRRSLTSLPGYWHANVNFGQMNFQIKNFGLAQTFLLRSIGINPGPPDQYFYLGMVYLEQNLLADAEAQFREAIARKPDGLGYHLALGLVLWRQGNGINGREELLKELESHPENRIAREQLLRITPR